MSDSPLTPEICAGVVSELNGLLPSGVIVLSRSNQTLWRDTAYSRLCASLPSKEQHAIAITPPDRRVGAQMAADESSAYRRLIQQKLNRAMQRVRRQFEALRRPTSPPADIPHEADAHHNRCLIDDPTTLPSNVIEGWLSDTSKITKPLLLGKGERR